MKVAEDDVFGRKLQDLDLLSVEKNNELSKVAKLEYELRSKLNIALKRGSFSKDNKLSSIIGCGFSEFINHLEDNEYGFRVGEKEVDLDHIIPTSRAKTEEELKKLNHYTNLQLLPSYYNRNVKGDKNWNKEDFDKWFKTF